MGGALFPPYSLAWSQAMVGVMVTSSKRTFAVPPKTAAVSAPDSAVGHCQQQASLAQSLVGSLLFPPGPWCAQGFVVSSKSLFSRFYNRNSLRFKVKFPRGSQSFCQIPRLGNLLWGLEVL